MSQEEVSPLLGAATPHSPPGRRTQEGAQGEEIWRKRNSRGGGSGSRGAVHVLWLGAILIVAGLALSRAGFLSRNAGEEDLETLSLRMTPRLPHGLPHVILLYADDQGYNDIGYQSTDLSELTPHLDSLAATGIKLTNYYGMDICTPSRAALLTGMLTIHTGMQHSMISGVKPWGLPLNLNIMPQYFKRLGFATHCGTLPGHRSPSCFRFSRCVLSDPCSLAPAALHPQSASGTSAATPRTIYLWPGALTATSGFIRAMWTISTMCRRSDPA